jgi:hypothetical protein
MHDSWGNQYPLHLKARHSSCDDPWLPHKQAACAGGFILLASNNATLTPGGTSFQASLVATTRQEGCGLNLMYIAFQLYPKNLSVRYLEQMTE